MVPRADGTRKRRASPRWAALVLFGAAVPVACSGGDDTAHSTASTTSSGASASNGSGGAPSGKCTSDPGAPYTDALVHIGRADSDESIEVLDVVADHPTVYACTSVEGFNIWDASAEGPPKRLAGPFAPPGLVGGNGKAHCQHVGLDKANKKVVITNRGDEIQPTPFLFLVDVANPSQPVPLRGVTGVDPIEGAALSGKRIYAAAHGSGIITFEDQGGSSLVEVGRFFDAQSDAWMPVLVGNHLLVAEGDQGLRVYDVSGAVPVPVAQVPIEGSSKDLVVDGGIAYVAASSRVVSVDVSDPTKPQKLGEVKTQGTAIALAMGANQTLLVAEWDRIRGYDVSDAAAMKQEISEIPPTNKLFSRVLTVDTAPEAGRVYPGEWSGVHAYKQIPCPVGPDIDARTEQVSFATIAPGAFDVRALVIENHGNRPLKISSITTTSPTLTMSDTSLSIDVGKAAAVEVTFKPVDTSGVKAKVVFASDDPDQPSLSIRVSGNLPGVDVGDQVPAFSLVDTDGKTWDSTALKGKVAVLSYFATF